MDALQLDRHWLNVLSTADGPGLVAVLHDAGAADLLTAARGEVWPPSWHEGASWNQTLEQALMACRTGVPANVRSELAARVRRRGLRARLPTPPGCDAPLPVFRQWVAETVSTDVLHQAASLVLPMHDDLRQHRRGLDALSVEALWALPRSAARGPAPLHEGSRVVDPQVLEHLVAALLEQALIAEDVRVVTACYRTVPAVLGPQATGLWHELVAVWREGLAEGLRTGGPLQQRSLQMGVELHHDGEIVVRGRGMDTTHLRAARPPSLPLLPPDLPRIWRQRLAGSVLDALRVPGPPERLQILEAVPDASWIERLGEPGEERALLGWRVLDKEHRLTVLPVLVTDTSKGQRSKKVALREVEERAQLTEVDREVLRRLRQAREGGLGGDAAAALEAEAISQLVGHPRVFTEGATTSAPVPVVRRALGLSVQPDGGWVRLRWTLDELELGSAELLYGWPRLTPQQGLRVLHRADRILVAEIPRAVVQVLPDLVRGRDSVPPGAVGALLDRLPHLDELVEVRVAPSLAGRETGGDATPFLRLGGLELGGLEVSVLVRPGPDQRTFAPGLGPLHRHGSDALGRLTLTRDRTEEQRQASQLVQGLGLLDVMGATFTTALELDRSVDLLEALATRPDVVVEWASPRRIVRTVGGGGVKVRLRDAGRWLGLDGSVEVDGATVDLERVLQALRAGRPYLVLDDTRLLRLRDDLAAKLADVADLTWKQGDAEVVGHLAAPALDALDALGVQLEAPPSWTRTVADLRRAWTHEPRLPDGLQATLRPYQADGVRWLLRLAAWGLGAVLADDMGLGKTLQALAVLVDRGPRGPALVVAPTSVVGSWTREAARFAPDLRVRVHHGQGRTDDLAHLDAQDVLITSWGTLVADVKLLEHVDFATVVLDEAHAIKNPATRRAHAARALRARFVLALSGTPVENHPGELWSLFQVVAPGLLGPQEAFHARFTHPILAGDPHARTRLASLVRPFLLRRTKGQVAQDLPAREEILVPVTLGPDERVIYDSLRAAAVASLDGELQDQPILILAALTRLRQAACHSGLVVEGAKDSAKLKAARRALAELHEAGHRALVFSQFVRLLDVLADQLASTGLRIGRLDGRSSRTAREAAVQAFQDGHTDVLLLSLQAGGVGLTLTAATYVLHLDPWWNPSVQDQATDRAHRIGQTDPVTVLHFISDDTVEQGIRELQEQKRGLVEDLLAGTGEAARLSTEDLLRLVRGSGVG